MKPPPDVDCLKDGSLITWRPRGVLDESKVNKILAFVVEQERKFGRDFDRFTDTSTLQGVELSFKYVFHVALYRRLSRAGREPVKSAFLVIDPEIARYIKLHVLMTDHSPLQVAMFGDLAAAAKWLDVSVETLKGQT